MKKAPPREHCIDRMHILALKNADKAELKAIFDRNGIAWKEHGAELPGRDPNTGALVDPDDPALVAYVEVLLWADRMSPAPPRCAHKKTADDPMGVPWCQDCGKALLPAPPRETGVYGWHFLAADGMTAEYSGRPRHKVHVGLVLTAEPPIVPCGNGLHGSLRLADALEYAPGPILTRCRYSGEIERHPDKFAAERREVLWMGDVSEILHLAACHFAETALRVAKVTDKRSWVAIEAKRGWLRGEITDKELTAARYAARYAAWYAATDAATAAARDAAWAAAWDAATDAATAAATDAATAAARDAAWGATWDAAWDAQNDWLECAVREMAGVDQ